MPGNVAETGQWLASQFMPWHDYWPLFTAKSIDQRKMGEENAITKNKTAVLIAPREHQADAVYPIKTIWFQLQG